MSSVKVGGNNLHPLQRLIVLNFAESEPQTINETAKVLGKSYKPTWSAFNSLEKKKIIQKVDVKKYQSREYPLFWLTAEGMIEAMLEGVDRVLLLEKARKIFPDERILHCFLEMVQQMNPLILGLAGSIVRSKGRLGFVEYMSVLISDATYETDEDTMNQLVSVLKRYPEEYAKTKDYIEKMIKQLNRLIND